MPRPSHIRPVAAMRFPTGTWAATTTQVMSETTSTGQSPVKPLPYAPMMYLASSAPMMARGSVIAVVILSDAVTTFAERVLSPAPMRSARMGMTD